MNMSCYQALIRELGVALAVPDMEADEGGYLSLTIDSLQIHLQYDEEADDILVFAGLLALDNSRKVEIYEQLLAANLFWRGTRGGTFSVDFDSGWVYLANRLATTGLELKTLELWLELFVNLVLHWQQLLEGREVLTS
ncbi:type III secretion system chaperone [Iodobacter sp. LRB]|uniref:type III secretion system chaperone n=1 Tax=unclassified Iodobacter TaxID=235634 RepID=UPI000C0F5274|nr:type III secretion system chaperone [Iodobacter sp. BJB302]PHV00075.1 hypothetical protein CSQ88_19055 [Iodobacter sp. BJB302]